MPGLINRFPRGLLGLLDAKTNGKTPEGLADLVMPVLDIVPFYLASSRVATSDTTAAVGGVGATFGGGGLLDVPSDELWMCESYVVTSSVALAAGETLGIVPIIRLRTELGATADMDLGQILTAGQGPTLWSRSASQAPFYALPGDRLGVFIYHRVVYAGTLRCDLRFSRFKI